MAWQIPKTNWQGGNVPSSADFNRIEGNSLQNHDDIDVHKADYTLQVPYGGTTAGAANTYTIATPTITTLATGMAVSFMAHQDSTGACTLNWNSKGAKALKKPNGANAVIKSGAIYTVRYNGTNCI